MKKIFGILFLSMLLHQAYAADDSEEASLENEVATEESSQAAYSNLVKEAMDLMGPDTEIEISKLQGQEKESSAN